MAKDALRQEVLEIELELKEVGSLFRGALKNVPEFDIADPKLLPYGLKPHTRSVSWIVEQVITQQMKFHAQKMGLKDVDIDIPDTALHDCILIRSHGVRLYVNVKTHQHSGKKNKNDISAVEKLYFQYHTNPDYRLIYFCAPITFANTTIRIHADECHVFSPQFMPIYVNPRNDKLQAFYEHEPQSRTRATFLELLRDNSTSIKLT